MARILEHKNSCDKVRRIDPLPTWQTDLTEQFIFPLEVV